MRSFIGCCVGSNLVFMILEDLLQDEFSGVYCSIRSKHKVHIWHAPQTLNLIKPRPRAYPTIFSPELTRNVFEYTTRFGLQSVETFQFVRDYDRSQAALTFKCLNH